MRYLHESQVQMGKENFMSNVELNVMREHVSGSWLGRNISCGWGVTTPDSGAGGSQE